ncbi:helix-turn-helix domain-containing protein [Gracilinema caldarium]|uniref:helix-turn-helix domain-containing protein n=1 Tax=Gracilinema caldarium TaxID=215591 RepID=UPI00350E4828
MISEQSKKALKTIPAILSIGDTAATLKCSRATIRRLIKRGDLKAFFTPEGWMVYRGDLINYLSNHSNL